MKNNLFKKSIIKLFNLISFESKPIKLCIYLIITEFLTRPRETSSRQGLKIRQKWGIKANSNKSLGKNVSDVQNQGSKLIVASKTVV